ncbi:MAG: uroporphyrinogen decarboxylase family protein [Planctomycetota bacterium]|jgi:hypothetical protein
MTFRQRLIATLNHAQPDRVCVDLGATAVSGISASTLAGLRRAVLGEKDYRVRVVEPYQMLGETDPALREALGIDVIGVPPRRTLFGFENTGWKPFTLFDGTEVLVPEGFRTTTTDDGDLLIHPGGDLSAPARGRMPKGGFYFDAIVDQQPIDEDALDPADNLEEFAPLSDDDLAWYRDTAAELADGTDAGMVLTVPGAAFGDIALVPAPWLPRPRGIRGVEEWYISTAARRDYVHAVFERQCEIALGNIDRLAEAVGDRVQAAFVTGTDFGTQRGPFLSVEAYRDLFKPYHTLVNRRIHERTGWKTFIHSCGSVFELMGDFIEAGFDILNPVQCSAAKMDPRELKTQFGRDIVFWGGGVDTQRTLPFGTPEEVYRQVRDRIEIFNDGGGFVFNPIHNIQPRTPVENVLAMFRAIGDSNG